MTTFFLIIAIFLFGLLCFLVTKRRNLQSMQNRRSSSPIKRYRYDEISDQYIENYLSSDSK